MSDAPGTSPGWHPDAQKPRRIRPSNNLGPISLALGVVGVFFGLIPATFFIAAPLGVAGFLVGRAGHRRCVIGKATNGRIAMAGSVISGAAVVLACFGAVITFTSVLD